MMERSNEGLPVVIARGLEFIFAARPASTLS